MLRYAVPLLHVAMVLLLAAPWVRRSTAMEMALEPVLVQVLDTATVSASGHQSETMWVLELVCASVVQAWEMALVVLESGSS